MSNNDPELQPSTCYSSLHLRRRTNTATSYQDPQESAQTLPNEPQPSVPQMVTRANTSSYSEASDSCQPSHSSSLKTSHPNHKIESFEKEACRKEASQKEGSAERTDSRDVEQTCTDLSKSKRNQLEDANEQVEEEPLCRICLGGRDDDDPALGRFIQPCLCRGTMAYIHVGCLQRWRITSPSLKSFYKCDQCGYSYKLRRAKIAGLAQNKAILGGVTFMVFFILVILSGFIAGWLLESYSQITTVDANWDDSLSPFSYDSTGKIVGEVVGEAVRVLNSKLHVGVSQSRGTTPVSRSKLTPQAQSARQVSKLKAIQTDENEAHSYRYVRTKTEKEHQDQLLAVYSTRPDKQLPTEAHRHSTSIEKKQDEQSTDDDEARKNNSRRGRIFQSILSGIFLKLEALIKHTIKGLAFIGVMSFFQLAMSVTLFSPWNFGIRNSVLRMMRTGTGGTRTPGRPGDPNGIGSLLILLFVLLGVLKAIQSVWKFVRKSSQWALRKIEDGVLDVRSS